LAAVGRRGGKQGWRNAAATALALALALAGAGCGGGDPATTSSPPVGGDEPGAAAQSEAPQAPRSPESAQLWFTTGEQFHQVERRLPKNGSQLAAAAEALVAGPTRDDRRGAAGAQTQIPAGAEVRGVSLGAGGTAVVRLSAEFMNGIPSQARRRTRAEQLELNARLGQVTYTLTQFEGVRSAKVVAGGAAIEPAIERADYAKPAQGPKLGSRSKGVQSAGARKLQERLAELRFLPRRAIDGVDGYRTQQAVIAFQSWNGLERDGIVGPATSAALAKAKPPRPQGQGPARRIEVYREQGVALLIADGRVKQAIHVSAGAPGTSTPSGSYEVFRKELRSWSVPFSVWLPYASYFNQGIAFHEYPEVPTYPASHGCVRVPAPEAPGVYKFAKVGTAVVVI
jgi:lipoprotein-anchoring transpeptidase ErfK/SrfK